MTTYLQRLGDAMQLLCSGHRPPDAVLRAWVDRTQDDFELQFWAATYGPEWAQGIVLIDAAQLLAETPAEDEGHQPAPD
jgi:hypothetical protein